RGQARVGERDVLHGVEVAEREQEAWVAHDHVVGHRAGRTEAGWGDPELGGTAAVVLLAARALGAPSATLRSVDGDRVAHVDPRDTGTERVDNAGAFVTERERQPEGVVVRAELHDEDVGVAGTGRGDLEANLARA